MHNFLIDGNNSKSNFTFFLSLFYGISYKLLIIGKLALNLLYLIFEPNLNHLNYYGSHLYKILFGY